MENIVLSKELSTIRDYAFEGCYSLGNIILPKKVGFIGYSVFKDCDKLKDVYCYALNPPTINNYTFSEFNRKHSFKIHLPKISESKYVEAWSGVWNKVFDLDADIVAGDVDDNEVVDVNDVTALINYILDGYTDGVNVWGADVDGNGEIDVLDVTALINMILQ